ncbi:hypothetical protein BMH32_12025 [Leucobacter sp. OLJS4]|nr:hypothetical protein BMH27_05005 [Leucobacter sp. OLAS13]PII95660.1 hypothetical protein BMH26_01605 [Leucobacter sp. OLTLW20]PII98876.1 hypothetical protein BMH28_12160 [Leucobacter sp. OLCS4]PII99833.1 hypothetical protein BMH29_04810 [Leucobacter sp. OLDS2]PIJ02691.1 hypothetical protein BMH31_09655 [Leucobacter sp. OLIS6]PIJ07709.1 hypothetical protein BMH32_12025 [Leucobacter sp. OLJS4]PIJ48388.1 hypothetical protein BMH30_05225 [Leucobacter sp. OLES1]PIJ57271.1 hypothetical protein 
MRDRFRWLRIQILEQVHVLGHRVDLLFGERLVVQIDGRTHQGAQRRLDNGHDAALRRHGYEVIRVSYEQVMFRWAEVHEAIIGAIARACTLHRPGEAGRPSAGPYRSSSRTCSMTSSGTPAVASTSVEGRGRVRQPSRQPRRRPSRSTDRSCEARKVRTQRRAVAAM